MCHSKTPRHNSKRQFVYKEIKSKYVLKLALLKILSYNGTESKNQLFTEVFAPLGVECKIYCLSYHSQTNGRIEGFHKFFKACMSQHVS